MTPSAGQRNGPSAEQSAFLQEALAAASALCAANRLGVLSRLNAAPADPAALARDCAISNRGARLLLAALTSLGLLEVSEDGWYRSVTPDSELLSSLVESWGRLSEAIRDGRPTADAGTPTIKGAHLDTWSATAAERAADQLASRGSRLLDIDTGGTPWSLALAARNPDSHITLVVPPAIKAATRRMVTAAGYPARFDYLEGDPLAVDLGRSAYDLAIAGSVCHLSDEATNRYRLGRLFDALRPGGIVAIMEALPTERFDGPQPVILYALGLLLRTSSGRVHPFSTYVGWLRDAGYEAVERVDLSTAPPISLITARRPVSHKDCAHSSLDASDDGRTTSRSMRRPKSYEPS